MRPQDDLPHRNTERNHYPSSPWPRGQARTSGHTNRSEFREASRGRWGRPGDTVGTCWGHGPVQMEGYLGEEHTFPASVVAVFAGRA